MNVEPREPSSLGTGLLLKPFMVWEGRRAGGGTDSEAFRTTVLAEDTGFAVHAGGMEKRPGAGGRGLTPGAAPR